MNLSPILTASPIQEDYNMRIVFEAPEPDDPSVPDDDNGDDEEE